MWILSVCEQAVLFNRTSETGTVAHRSAHKQRIYVRLDHILQAIFAITFKMESF